MSEEQKTEQPTGDIGAGSKPEAAGLVDKAYSAAERLELANRKTEELLARQEALYSKQLLGGRADAGQQVKPKTTEDIAQEKADAVMQKWFPKRR